MFEARVGLADSEQVHVGARVDDEGDAAGISGFARRPYALDGNVQIVEARSAVVNLVFEIDSDGAGVDDAANGLGDFVGVVGKAGFDVRRDGKRHDASDTAIAAIISSRGIASPSG